MKKYLIGALIGTIGIITFVACDKEIPRNAEYKPVGDAAFIRIVHAAPSFRQIFNIRDTFNVYHAYYKLNSAFLTYGGTFPAGAGYAAVIPGLHTFRITVHGVNAPDSGTIFTIDKTLKPGEYYTFVITDSIKSTNDAAQMWLNDKLPSPPDQFFSLRLINAVLNDTAGKNIDIYSTRMRAPIFSNITPGTVTPFINVPYNRTLSDTLIVRRAGTTFELARLNTANFGNQRVYTLYYRGNGRIATGVRPRSLLLTTNR